MATTTIKSGSSDSQAFVDSTGALKVTVSGGGGDNASVSTTGTTAPTSATLVGALNGSGNLTSLLVDPDGKLLVDASGTTTVDGTISANINGLPVFQTSQYTVGTTPVELTVSPLTNRSSVSFKAVTTGTNIIYISNTNAVSTTTGYPLFNGDSLQLDLTGAGSLWVVATASGQTMAVLEIG